jgi:hypothetical protein
MKSAMRAIDYLTMSLAFKRLFEERLKGTPFEGLKAVVLDHGLKLTLLDSQGRVLNRRLEDGSQDA